METFHLCFLFLVPYSIFAFCATSVTPSKREEENFWHPVGDIVWYCLKNSILYVGNFFFYFLLLPLYKVHWSSNWFNRREGKKGEEGKFAGRRHGSAKPISIDYDASWEIRFSLYLGSSLSDGGRHNFNPSNYAAILCRKRIQQSC